MFYSIKLCFSAQLSYDRGPVFYQSSNINNIEDFRRVFCWADLFYLDRANNIVQFSFSIKVTRTIVKPNIVGTLRMIF